MIVLKYLGKKAGFTLRLPYLSQTYTIEGPGAEVPFTNADATNIMATSPKMFQVIGVSRDEPKSAEPEQIVPERVVAPPDETAAAAARELLKDDPPNPSLGEPKTPLTGDGIEGGDDPPADKPDTPEAPAAVPDGPVSIANLMTYKVPELRAYAKSIFGHEFGPDDKRNDMIKKIKELEQAKAQAAS